MLLLETGANTQQDQTDEDSQTDSPSEAHSPHFEMKAVKAKLARLINKVSAPFRGLLGMAFTVDGENAIDLDGSVLLPNDALRIWAMLDGRSIGGRRVLLSELRAKVHHGSVVSLSPTGPTYDTLLDFDETSRTFQSMGPVPRGDEGLIILAAQMDWLMAATAANARRQGWEKVQKNLDDMAWPTYSVRHAARHRPAPAVWAPVPYVQTDLDAATATHNFSKFSMSLRARFMDHLRSRLPVRAPAAGRVWLKSHGVWLNLSQGRWKDRCLLGEHCAVFVENGQEVQAGTPLACDWPVFGDDWHRLEMRRRWQDVVELLGASFREYFTLWWERQRLKDWLPLPLATCGRIVSEQVAWDLVLGIVPFFDDTLQTYIVPPVFPRDLRFHGELANGVEYDLRSLLA